MAAGTAAAISAEAAVRMHQAGDVAGAAAAYRRLLAGDPRNAQLLNLLGVALLQMGNAAEAVDLLKDAVRRQPASADFQDNLGSALRAAGQPAPAVDAHRKALRLRPDHPPFLFNLANALAAMGAHHQAIEAYGRSLAGRPGHAGALFNLSNSQRAVGDLTAAAATCRQLLSAQPSHAQAWNNLGAILALQGELSAAEDAYRQALAARPGHAETLSNLGNVLVERGRLGEGLECHLAAVAAAPGSADGHIFLGVAWQELDRMDAAIAAYREGLRLDPGNIRGMTNLGAALELVGRLGEADAILSQALTLAPGSAEVWGNLGLCRLAQGDAGRARAALDRALELDPDLARARVSRALLRLEDGDVAGGWSDYAWRFAAGEALPDRRFTVPAWNGQPLASGRLLIWREQGLGDELMFASLYREAVARAGTAIIECDPRLLGLFTRSFPQAIVRPQKMPRDLSDAPERVDAAAHIPAGSLAGLLRPSLSAFDPSAGPFLVVDRRRKAQAGEWLDGLPPGLRVGICWRSRMVTTRRRLNYAAPAAWAPLLSIPQLQIINLQYAAEASEIEEMETAAGRRLHTMPGLDLTNDLDGLAALIEGLDLVVTAPTAVGEMAGAVGTPVWRVAGERDWSTLGSGVRPWFASMRIFAYSSGPAAGVAEVIRVLGQILRPHG